MILLTEIHRKQGEINHTLRKGKNYRLSGELSLLRYDCVRLRLCIPAKAGQRKKIRAKTPLNKFGVCVVLFSPFFVPIIHPANG